MTCSEKSDNGRVYRIGSVLGTGAYAEVRVAEDIDTGKLFAIKLAREKNIGSLKDANSIKEEIRIVQSIGYHRHIAKFEDTATVELVGRFCGSCGCTGHGLVDSAQEQVCTECDHHLDCHSEPTSRCLTGVIEELGCGGELLRLVQHCGPLPEDTSKTIFAQLLLAVAHLHENNVFHRDIKPENVVFTHDFELKLIDFGLARQGSAEETRASSSYIRGCSGTLPYAAPEVVYSELLYNSKSYCGGKADIWSCGVLLYVLLTGKVPFQKPLSQTYNHRMRKDRNFSAILKKKFPSTLSHEAQDLLGRVFVESPEHRIHIQGLLSHPWLQNRPNLTASDRSHLRLMAKETWQSNLKTFMVNTMLSREDANQHDEDDCNMYVSFEGIL